MTVRDVEPVSSMREWDWQGSKDLKTSNPSPHHALGRHSLASCSPEVGSRVLYSLNLLQNDGSVARIQTPNWSCLGH